MLCACSGEQFKFEDVPRSPESLATRDFSASGLSSRTADWESKLDVDSRLDEVESALKDTVTLNYEEARALLGRLEYLRGNFDAALQVFQGIDVRGLRSRMIRAIDEWNGPRPSSSKNEILLVNVMSIHSVSLLLEAILLKSKSLEALGRAKDAALECKTILDIVESAWPNGIVHGIGEECKLEEILHTALEVLPKLWKQAGFLEEVVAAYRRALIRPWNLDPKRLASIQKDLAAILLYGGVEESLPLQLQQPWAFAIPGNNLDEAILLLLILMRKVAFQEISWDLEIIDHLTFALSLSGQFECLANQVEQILPGVYNRAERWYVLALCYSAAGLDDVALFTLRKVLGYSERRQRPHFPSLLLGAKLCHKDATHACDGVSFALRVFEFANDQEKHLLGVASHWLGVCYGYCARRSISELERLKFQNEALRSLEYAASIETKDPEVMYHLGMENAIQRNMDAALENATKYMEMVSGSSESGWKLLALTTSAKQNLNDAEGIADLAIDEAGEPARLQFLRLKALLQVAQEQPKHAIDTYRTLLTMIQAQRVLQAWNPEAEAKQQRSLEMEAWLDLASIYAKLESWINCNACLDKAKAIEYFSHKIWHATGMAFEARSSHKDALAAFSTSLSIDPDYIPAIVSLAAALGGGGRNSTPIAKSLLMNALRLEPTNHEAWLNLGLISKSEGSLRRAADCFQASYELWQSCPVQNFA